MMMDAMMMMMLLLCAQLFFIDYNRVLVATNTGSDETFGQNNLIYSSLTTKLLITKNIAVH